MSNSILTTLRYNPPAWILNSGINCLLIPKTRIELGRFPTPIHSLTYSPLNDLGLELHIKRDDLSSFDLSGNKVRKLEFLMAEATDRGCDSVITIGGVQSNHARATAVAARQLSMDPFLVLRQSKLSDTSSNELGLTGNLLLDRLVGADIRLVSAGTYAQIGSDNLVAQLGEELRSIGKNPYEIPVGGSNVVGVFGYISFIEELITQNISYDHIVFACGSGGTAAGIAIGARLSGLKARLHAVGVCDTPAYFYDHINEMCTKLGLSTDSYGSAENWINIYQGQGIGYAKSTQDELETLVSFAQETGIVLDPVYSGKAFHYFSTKLIQDQRDVFRSGDKILFVHTGGTLGLYDKEKEILPLLVSSKISKMKVRSPN